MDEKADVVETMPPVLVYGSLKRGFANHHWLAGAQLLGEAAMAGLALHDLGPFPMAVPDPTAACLHGQLYRVDDTLLSRLDRLEGVPRLYQRQLWGLVGGGEAWVYVGRPAQVRHSPRIGSGRWSGPRPGRSSRPEPRPT
jgi:gamma-glutamylcyclotransferase (GGCT)/AIG2-like uncharacterized protein YtfP